MEQEEAEGDVVIFPFPAVGHVNSMLKLAHLLSLSGLRIAFLNIHPIHQKLTLHSDIQSRFSLIFNTFEDLERPILSCLRRRCPNMYAIGPLHSHLKSRLSSEKSPSGSESFNALSEVDRSCLAWLDAQPLLALVALLSWGKANSESFGTGW